MVKIIEINYLSLHPPLFRILRLFVLCIYLLQGDVFVLRDLLKTEMWNKMFLSQLGEIVSPLTFFPVAQIKIRTILEIVT